MKGIYEIIMCKDQKHDDQCNFKLEDSDVEQFIAAMEEATKEFFSKQSSIPTITLDDIEDLLRREIPKDPIKISDQYMYHFQDILQYVHSSIPPNQYGCLFSARLE